VADVLACQFFPSGEVLLTGGADSQVRVWYVPSYASRKAKRSLITCDRSVTEGYCAAIMKGHGMGVLVPLPLLHFTSILSSFRNFGWFSPLLYVGPVHHRERAKRAVYESYLIALFLSLLCIQISASAYLIHLCLSTSVSALLSLTDCSNSLFARRHGHVLCFCLLGSV
jgi:hypothetical protein